MSNDQDVGHKGGRAGGYLYTLLPPKHVSLLGTHPHSNNEPTESNYHTRETVVKILGNDNLTKSLLTGPTQCPLHENRIEVMTQSCARKYTWFRSCVVSEKAPGNGIHDLSNVFTQQTSEAAFLSAGKIALNPMVHCRVQNTALTPSLCLSESFRPLVINLGYAYGTRKTSYINQNETQEPLEPWTSSDPRTREDQSPNCGAGKPTNKLNHLFNTSEPH
jgi:hypothetical protein